MEAQKVFYRGESKNNGELACVPSIFRGKFFGCNLVKESKYYELIHKSISEFALVKTISDVEDIRETYYLKYLGVLQHYGFPTRLLDVSNSERIARYFACSNNFQEDGYIYIICDKNINFVTGANAKSIERKIRCIQNPDLYMKQSVWELMDVQPRYHGTITENVIVDYKNVCNQKSFNLRYTRQHGAFVLFGFQVDEHGLLHNEFTRIKPYKKETVKSDAKFDTLINLCFDDKNEPICNAYIYPDSDENMALLSEYELLSITNEDFSQMLLPVIEDHLHRYKKDIAVEKRSEFLEFIRLKSLPSFTSFYAYAFLMKEFMDFFCTCPSVDVESGFFRFYDRLRGCTNSNSSPKTDTSIFSEEQVDLIELFAV